MSIFDPDSKFMILTNTILDYVKIGLLFLLFSLPVFTVGAAAAAGMTVALKIELGKAPAIWKPFKKAFRDNFKQATSAAVLILAVYALLGFDWYCVMNMESNGLVRVIRMLIVLLALFLTMISFYVFANFARYELSNRAAFHNAVIYSILNFPKNLLAVAIIIIGIWGYYYIRPIVPVVICAIPALEFYYLAKICVKTFRRIENQAPKGGNDV